MDCFCFVINCSFVWFRPSLSDTLNVMNDWNKSISSNAKFILALQCALITYSNSMDLMNWIKTLISDLWVYQMRKHRFIQFNFGIIWNLSVLIPNSTHTHTHPYIEHIWFWIENSLSMWIAINCAMRINK